MGKLVAILWIFLSLNCVWSYYPQQGPPMYPGTVMYRHHYPAYPTHMMGPPVAPYPYSSPPQVSYAPAATLNAPYPSSSPYTQAPSPYGPHPMPYGGAPSLPFSPRPMPYGGGPSPPVPNPLPFHQMMYTHVPYAPAATYQHNFIARPHMPPPPPPAPQPQSSRSPFNNPFVAPFQTTAFSHNVPKHSIFTKLKPFLLGNPGQRSLPHHPYYPSHYQPHHFTPSRPLQNRPAAHHQYPVHQQAPHHIFQHLKQEHSCSCSLHVGHLTVYKHTDMRSSYSCQDLKDCNSFCTNLFSSEDLRAQTRSDACLILGKDGSFPWFRRDQVCDPNGVKNDTKLSVDLCCKQLQPC